MLTGAHVSLPTAAAGLARSVRPVGRSIGGTPHQLLHARTLAELRDLLGNVLEDLYPDVARFELYVTDAHGRLAPVAEPESAPSSAARQLLASVRARLEESGGTLAEPRAVPAAPHLRRGSILSSPLLDGREGLIGLVVVEASSGARDFGHLHLAALESVGALLSVAVQRLGDVEPERRRVRAELDRRAARDVQRRLMRVALPPGIGLTAYAEYLPALDVGGDFYALRHLGDARVGVAVGDVSGNGMSAALLMSRVAADVERALVAGDAPSTVLGSVNDALQDVESESFVTASCLQLDVRSRRVVVANAGHLPLLVRRATGEVFTCGASSGTPLGVQRCAYEDEELTLEPEDIVLLMTDGLLETLDHPSGERGLELLAALVQRGSHDASAVHARIRATVEEARRAHLVDDVTWLVLHLGADLRGS